ncbi:DUF3221 domain-containing protein [Bacillus sp. MRMR6]|uniref:DUF3221 domain-containing protein n=1 Tax=Bacillus sp. MRMR6 TaxID=1928617 RepID=UPI0009FB6E32|nr:DUF3221 domain-containing protein [Bacillus sp. MRMR6]
MYTVKKILLFAILFSFIWLAGCIQKDDSVKGEYDVSGVIKEVDADSKAILVDDPDKGLIWITLPKNAENTNFEPDQTVAVWTDGKIRESYPLQATALNIELITP